MTDEYRKRIGEFLSNYLNIEVDGYSYENKDVIKQGIGMLIKEGIFSAEELQRMVLKESSALIPLSFINKCVCG